MEFSRSSRTRVGRIYGASRCLDGPVTFLNTMSWRSLLLIFAIALLAAACTQAETEGSVRVTAAGGNVPAQPDIESPEELEALFIEFGECVEEGFPITMRFRTDHFVGFETEIGSRLESEGDAVDRAYAGCSNRLDLDRRISAYQSANPLTPQGDKTLAAEFVACVSNISSGAATRVADANIDTYEAAERFVFSTGTMTTGLNREELLGISACISETVGEQRVFADGHPWFRPSSS